MLWFFQRYAGIAVGLGFNKTEKVYYIWVARDDLKKLEALTPLTYRRGPYVLCWRFYRSTDGTVAESLASFWSYNCTANNETIDRFTLVPSLFWKGNQPRMNSDVFLKVCSGMDASEVRWANRLPIQTSNLNVLNLESSGISLRNVRVKLNAFCDRILGSIHGPSDFKFRN